METQILLAEDLDLTEKGKLGTPKKDLAEIKRLLKALIKSLEKNLLSAYELWRIEFLDPLLQVKTPPAKREASGSPLEGG